MKESNIRDKFTKCIKGLGGDVTNHEDRFQNGIPDSSYGLDMVNGWVEHKYLQNFPAKESTLIKAGLKKGQKIWIKQRQKAAGHCFILIGISNQIFLFSGDMAQEIYDGLTKEHFYSKGVRSMARPNRQESAQVPIVWLIQEPYHPRDLKSVIGFGNIETVLSKSENPSVHPDSCFNKMTNILSHCRPDDYILWAGGDPCAAFMAGLVLGQLKKEGLIWLRWDRHTNSDGERKKHGYYSRIKLFT